MADQRSLAPVRAFEGRMSDAKPDLPNVVLRGGPLDGKQVYVTGQVPVSFEVDGERVAYRPTAELDDEYPTLAIWVLDRVEKA